MSTATRIAKKRRLFGSNLTMAIALALGTTMGVVTLEAPASAQKKQKAPKLSKKFQKAYNEVVQLYNAETPDEAALRAALPNLETQVESANDRHTFGNLMFSIGGKIEDDRMRADGLKHMIDSGNESERVGLLQYNRYILLNGLDDLEGSRAALIAASDAGHTLEATMADGSTRNFNADDIRVMAAALYFDQDRYAEGLADLHGWLKNREAQGLPIESRWIRRGFATAFNEGLGDEASKFSVLFTRHHPSGNTWSDAIATQANYFEYNNQETLDLMRLARRVGAMDGSRVTAASPDTQQRVKQGIVQYYLYYGEAAGFNRLPGEVKSLLEKGVADGIVDAKDVVFKEWLDGAKGLVAGDRADLPSLEAEARSSSSVNLVQSAADVMLSYGEASKAEQLYTKALGMAGSDADRINTRMGIALLDQGKFDEAKASFAKVTGSRSRIAELWSVHADAKAKAAMPAPAPVPAPAT